MTLSTGGGSNHPAPILRLISWQNWLLTAQNLFSDEYFDLCPSIDTKNSLFICILLPLWAVKCRRSKIKFFKLKKVKISNFELLKCFIPQKKAENMYNSDLARKSKISCKKTNFFFDFSIFHQRLEDPWKFLTFNFPKLSKKNSKNDFSGTCQVLRGTKSKVLVSLTLALWKWQMDLRWCGMIWPPPQLK